MNRNQNYYASEIDKINKYLFTNDSTLKNLFNTKDLYLPDGVAYKIAYNLKRTNTNQLRKFLSMIKEAEHYAKNVSLDAGKEKLYRIVPLAAYAVGRKLFEKDFFDFIKNCITPKRLASLDDIIKFSTLFESIIAYRKEREEAK